MYRDFSTEPYTAEAVPPYPAAVAERPLLSLVAEAVVQTPDGPCRVDSLIPGACLTTRSGAQVTLLSATSLHLSRMELHQQPRLAPIRFDPGTLPGQADDVALLLAPDLPVFFDPAPGVALAGSFPAEAFCNGGTVRPVVPEDGVHYIRLDLSATADIRVSGVWVQSSGDRAIAVQAPSAPVDVPAESRVFMTYVG